MDTISGSLVSSANVELTGEGLNITLEKVGGSYFALVDSLDLDIGTKYLTLYASRGNYSEASSVVKVDVRRIEAKVQTAENKTVYNIKPGESITFKLSLKDLDFNKTLTNATVKYTWQNGQGELKDEDGDGIYELELNNVPEGTYTITITVFAGDDYEFERFEIELNVVRPPQEALLFQVLSYVGIVAAVAVGGYLYAYQKVLKYPKPVRKVRKYRKNLKKDKEMEDVEITDRDSGFTSAFAGSLGSIGKVIKQKPGKLEEKKGPNVKKETMPEIKEKTEEKVPKKTETMEKKEVPEKKQETKDAEK